MTRLLAAVLALAAASAAHGADVIRGAQLYRTHCAGCHGQRGMSTMPAAPNFARGERLMQPDASLAASIRTGRASMPGYFGILGDREILDVVAYLRSFR